MHQCYSSARSQVTSQIQTCGHDPSPEGRGSYEPSMSLSR